MNEIKEKKEREECGCKERGERREERERNDINRKGGVNKCEEEEK